jgi:dTDP-4-amino-4,6-dideoxygalactose transaminase
LKQNDVLAIFHYLPLHKSPFFKENYFGEPLPNAQRYADCLVRLPLFYELSNEDVYKIIDLVKFFYK